MKMSMKPTIILSTILLMFLTITSSSGQEVTDTTFKPNGNPILKVFANLHTGVNEGNTDAAWQIRRAYLGYEYNLSQHFYMQVKIDIGSPDDISEFSNIRRYAYFKNAMARYKKDKLIIDVGLIDMQHFILQEKFWGYRYIARSYSDRYKFGPKADIGMDVIYAINKYISFDVTFANGEGYTKLQRDNTFKVAGGINIFPVKGVSMRLYYDIMSKDVTESTIATFVGYKFKKLFRVAGEFNMKLNEYYTQDHNIYGYSIYGTYIFSSKFEAFARYDWLRSNIEDSEDVPWNIAHDGSSIIAGVQYKPHKKIKLALDYQDWVPSAANEDGVAYIFLNFEFKL